MKNVRGEVIEQVSKLDADQMRTILFEITLLVRGSNYEWSDLAEAISRQLNRAGISTECDGERR